MERLGDFDTFVRSSWEQLVRTAVFLGCTRHEAEDVVQTALLRCLESWDKVETARDPEAYVYRVLVNAFKKARSRKWLGEIPHGLASRIDPDSDREVDGPEDRELLRSLLVQLPPDQREVLVLRSYADLSERQVATAMKIPVGTVKSKTSRAIRRLDDLLKDLDPSHSFQRGASG